MKKRLIIVFISILIGAMVISTGVMALSTGSFSDLKENHWAFTSIQDMVMYNILRGYPDGTFQPDKKISRAEFSSIMSKALRLEENVAMWPSFKDVNPEHWAYPYIESVKTFLTGYTEADGMIFKPNEPTLREDAAEAMVRALHLENSKVDAAILEKFQDRAEISENNKILVAICVKNDFMQGTLKGFEPKKSLTRAESSTLLKRIIDKLQPAPKESFGITTIR